MPSILSFQHGRAKVLFVGRCEPQLSSAEDALAWSTATLGIEPPEGLAYCKQVHSSRVCDASPATTAEGDALVTPHRGLALAVVTADCVPVLFSAPNAVAAVHAGWRGLAGGILRTTLAHDAWAKHNAAPTAWIGPCMAGCCYEVGYDVALRVATLSGAGCIREPQTGVRPFLALEHAAAAQLRRHQVEDIRLSVTCTGCSCEDWWSYRREGPGAGRNYAFVWRS